MGSKKMVRTRRKDSASASPKSKSASLSPAPSSPPPHSNPTGLVSNFSPTLEAPKIDCDIRASVFLPDWEKRFDLLSIADPAPPKLLKRKTVRAPSASRLSTKEVKAFEDQYRQPYEPAPPIPAYPFFRRSPTLPPSSPVPTPTPSAETQDDVEVPSKRPITLLIRRPLLIDAPTGSETSRSSSSLSITCPSLVSTVASSISDDFYLREVTEGQTRSSSVSVWDEDDGGPFDLAYASTRGSTMTTRTGGGGDKSLKSTPDPPPLPRFQTTPSTFEETSPGSGEFSVFLSNPESRSADDFGPSLRRYLRNEAMATKFSHVPVSPHHRPDIAPVEPQRVRSPASPANTAPPTPLTPRPSETRTSPSTASPLFGGVRRMFGAPKGLKHQTVRLSKISSPSLVSTSWDAGAAVPLDLASPRQPWTPSLIPLPPSEPSTPRAAMEVRVIRPESVRRQSSTSNYDKEVPALPATSPSIEHSTTAAPSLPPLSSGPPSGWDTEEGLGLGFEIADFQLRNKTYLEPILENEAPEVARHNGSFDNSPSFSSPSFPRSPSILDESPADETPTVLITAPLVWSKAGDSLRPPPSRAVSMRSVDDYAGSLFDLYDNDEGEESAEHRPNLAQDRTQSFISFSSDVESSDGEGKGRRMALEEQDGSYVLRCLDDLKRSSAHSQAYSVKSSDFRKSRASTGADISDDSFNATLASMEELQRILRERELNMNPEDNFIRHTRDLRRLKLVEEDGGIAKDEKGRFLVKAKRETVFRPPTRKGSRKSYKRQAVLPYI